MHASNFQSRHQQQGIATVLIVVLLGLSLTITILVGLSNLRSSQELGVSMHTQTVTQQRAWLAAEALRGYLQEVTADYTDWLEFLDNFDLDNNVYPAITITGFEGLQAQFIGVDDTNPDRLLFSLELSAETAPDTRIASTSALQMTFAVVPPTPAGNQPPVTPSRNVITFYDGLDISADIETIIDFGDQYDVFVDGNVNISSVSLRGFDTIQSTKSIRYQGGSGGNFRELHASCDVFVSNVGGFTIDSIRGTNNVCVQNTANTASIEANGFVTVTGGAHNSVASLANTGGEANCATGSQLHCGFTNNNYGVDVGWSTTARRILTKGEIRSREALNVDAWLAEDIITFDDCPSPAPDVTSAVGVVVPSWCGSTFNIDADMNLAIPEVPPVTLDRETFDANLFRDSANYVYRRHNNATRVLVRNVEGIPDHSHVSNPQEVRDNGYFHRSSSVSNRPNYACRHPTANNDAENCWLLSTNNNNNDVHPSYSQGWILNGVSHAPGIVFFEGNLRIENGHYTNTFISTGNITVSSAGNSVAAPNYIGGDTRDIAVPDYSTYTYQGVCNNIYGLAPKDFCKPGGFDYTALSGLGNFALKAGSCPISSPGQCETNEYIGGDVAIAGPVLGVIKAGNIFSTSNQTRVEGYVSALALRGTGTTNKIGNRTIFDLSHLPPGYDPTGGAIADGEENGGNNESQQQAIPGNASLLWSRYL